MILNFLVNHMHRTNHFRHPSYKRPVQVASIRLKFGLERHFFI